MSTDYSANCEILKEFYFAFCDPRLGNEELLSIVGSHGSALGTLMDLAVGFGVTYRDESSVTEWAAEDIARGVRDLAKTLGHDDPAYRFSGWDDFVSQMENLGEDSLFSRLNRH